MDLERKKDKSSERELIHEFIMLVENDTTESDPKKLLEKSILELKKTYNNIKEGFSSVSPEKEADHMNKVFNEIQRLEILVESYKHFESDLKRIINDSEYRNKLKNTIEKLDHQNDKPSFFKNLMNKFFK